VLLCAEAGAAGYVPCDGTIDNLVDTIHSVARGELLCSPRIAATLFRALHVRVPKPDADRLALTLTAREREIAPLIDRGLSNKEIAAHLRIEAATVKNHVHNLLESFRSRRAARRRPGCVPVPVLQEFICVVTRSLGRPKARYRSPRRASRH